MTLRNVSPLALFVVLLAGCGRPAPAPAPKAAEAAAPAAVSVRVVDGRLINTEARYTLVIPDGWVLFDKVRPGLVVLRRGDVETAPTLAILARPATSDAAAEVNRLRDSLLGSPMGYEVLDERQREVAGHTASVLVTRFVFEGQGRVTHNVVLVAAGQCYVLGVEMPEALRAEVEADLERVLASIELGAA